LELHETSGDEMVRDETLARLKTVSRRIRRERDHISVQIGLRPRPILHTSRIYSVVNNDESRNTNWST